MKISGCYIVKNEEHNLERSIKSITGICDEIVVVDTGSTDGTVALAESLGARVLHFKWINDFAAARNFALDNAAGDLIIFLDADEWFESPLGEGERSELETVYDGGYQAIRVPFRDKIGDVFLAPMYFIRLFRGDPDIRYENAIHEALAGSFKYYNLGGRYTVLHSGYDLDLQDKKVERNLELLMNVLETETQPVNRMVYYFYVARESSMQKKLDTCIEYLDKFFELWNRAQGKRGMGNIAIAAHYLGCSFFLAQSFELMPDERCKRYVDAFVEEFPTHPISWLCLAEYHFKRTGDFISAQKALRRMDEMQAIYTPDTFLNDNTPLERYMPNALNIKGAIAYAFGDRLAAFDAYSSAMQASSLSNDTVRLLLHLVKEQSSSDIVAFLGSLKPEPTAQHIEVYLSELRYFPALKDVYMYYAMQHIRLSRQHSDMTAIASLFGDSSYDHVLRVAESTLETDAISADTLFLAAAFRANSLIFCEKIPSNSRIERLIKCFYEGVPIEEISVHELNIFSRAAQIIMLINRQEITDKMYAVLGNYKYERFLIKYNYFSKAGLYDRIYDSVDIQINTMEPAMASNIYYALGEAYLEGADHDNAYKNLRMAVEFQGANHEVFRDLRILASVAPRFSERVERLISMYDDFESESEADKRARAIRSTFNRGE